jgi:hypothetical protein
MAQEPDFDIPVYIDGKMRGTIRWKGSVAGLEPDDIRLARKLKDIEPLWLELLEKRVVRVAFDDKQLYLTTREGGKVFSKDFFIAGKAESGNEKKRVMGNDHPFLDICDFPGAPR